MNESNLLVHDTLVRTFASERAVRKGIEKLVEEGWRVNSQMFLPGKRGCIKTILWLIIFWPAALFFGKKQGKFQVIFEKNV